MSEDEAVALAGKGKLDRCLRAEEERDAAQNMMHVMQVQRDAVVAQLDDLRRQVVAMTAERDYWRDAADRNRQETRDVERRAAEDAKAAAAEIARLRAATFPDGMVPPETGALDDTEARFALLEL